MGIKNLLLVIMLLAVATSVSAKGKVFKIENKFLSRTLELKQGRLITTEIENKVSGAKIAIPDSSDEFSLRVSQGTDKEGTDRIITSKDFKFIKVVDNKTSGDNQVLSFLLRNDKEGLTVTLFYELNKNDSFLRKYLKIKSDKKICIERINIDSLVLKNDVYQPYKIKQLTINRARWRTGLGQPLYTKKSALFLGTEFPASDNYVKNDT